MESLGPTRNSFLDGWVLFFAAESRIERSESLDASAERLDERGFRLLDELCSFFRSIEYWIDRRENKTNPLNAEALRDIDIDGCSRKLLLIHPDEKREVTGGGRMMRRTFWQSWSERQSTTITRSEEGRVLRVLASDCQLCQRHSNGSV